MRTSSVLSLLAAATAASAQTAAPVVQGNPVGAQYLAVLPDKATTTVRGAVQIQSSADGKGVDVSVGISGLPATGGPFLYHIHEKPVPTDGNCTGTGAHLDPYKRGETPPCDATKPAECQTGDLSGKHGNTTMQAISLKYTDLYLATLPTDPSFFGNLSVVVHFANKTRITCANFTLQSPGAISSALPSASSLPVSVGTSSGYAYPTGTFNSTHSSTGTAGVSATGSIIAPTSSPAVTSSPASAAGKMAVGAGAVIAAAAALML